MRLLSKGVTKHEEEGDFTRDLRIVRGMNDRGIYRSLNIALIGR